MLGRHQQQVIDVLTNNGGGLVMSRLADIGISQRNVTRVCERLESLGIVKITVRRPRDRSGDLVELRLPEFNFPSVGN